MAAGSAPPTAVIGEPWPSLDIGVDISFLNDLDLVASELRHSFYSLMVTKKLRFKDLHDFDSNNPAHGGAGKRRASMKHTVRRNLRVQLQAAADVYGLELPQVRVPSPHSCHLHAVPSPHSAISMCLPCACHPHTSAGGADLGERHHTEPVACLYAASDLQ